MGTRRDHHKASGTRSFFDLARHPALIFKGSDGDASDDLENLRQGATVLVSAFLRQQGQFRQGRLSICAGGSPQITWERYRLLRGHSDGTSLYPPYRIGHTGRVAGRGAWNIKVEIFTAIGFIAGSAEMEFAVPAIDVEFLQVAVGLLNARSL